MVRPRSFDDGEVLNALIDRFWSVGFDGVTIRDLEAATGLKAASLYNAYGDKRELFRVALAGYIDANVRDRIDRHGRHRAADRIRGFVEEIVERSAGDGERKGCLMVNSAVEVAPRDAETRRVVNLAFRDVETFFRDAVREAVGEGNPLIPDPTAFARAVSALVMGLRVMARVGAERETLRDAALPLLSMLDAAIAKGDENHD